MHNKFPLFLFPPIYLHNNSSYFIYDISSIDIVCFVFCKFKQCTSALFMNFLLMCGGGWLYSALPYFILIRTGEKGNIQFVNELQQLYFIFILSLLRCECGVCHSMRTKAECVCCVETQAVNFIRESSDLECITHHQMFIDNCLNVRVLEVSLHDYFQRDGPLDDNEPIYE